MEGVPSTPAQRKRNHYIVLTVHGIAEPGNSLFAIVVFSHILLLISSRIVVCIIFN